MTKKLTSVTRRDIISSIRDGFEAGGIDMTFDLFGVLDEEDFLARLYDLNGMVSLDSRFPSALYELRCHRQSFSDYPDFWFFEDERFQLGDGSDDEHLLRMLCESLHPEVRIERGCWRDFLAHVNELLKPDGYVIACTGHISGREVFSAIGSEEELSALPVESYFRERYWRSKSSFGSFSAQDKGDIGADARYEVAEVLLRFREPVQEPLDRYSGLTRNTDAFAIAWNRFEEYMGEELLNIALVTGIYEHGCANPEYLSELGSDELLTIAELQHFELSPREKIDFRFQLNAALRRGKGCLALAESGLIVRDADLDMARSAIQEVEDCASEPGLRELVDEAARLFDRGTLEAKALAVEKLWDAFERLKTVYADLKKEQSAELLIDAASAGNSAFREVLEEEFRKLTEIGNGFRIRHHETGQNEISEEAHYDYLFMRCLIAMRLVLIYHDRCRQSKSE